MHPEYDFIFVGNRDEFKKRPSKGAHFWENHPHILAGIDLEKGGTWTGITTSGRMAFLTNFREPHLKKDGLYSRGFLTRDYLLSDTDPQSFLSSIKVDYKSYDPFNLVIGSIDDLWFYSNMNNKMMRIKPGIHGLSNAYLDTPWFKVIKAKERLSEMIYKDFLIDELFSILDDKEIPPDTLLPDTGIPIDLERTLSTIHIDTPTYGTLFKTAILIRKDGHVEYYERALDDHNKFGPIVKVAGFAMY
jgi:uncharacterized protein with NRDE domain